MRFDDIGTHHEVRPRNESEVAMSDHPPIVAEALQVHGALYDDELEQLLSHWTNLDQRLQSFAHRSIRLDLHIHDRDTPAQRVTLEAYIGGFPKFVTTEASRDLGHALNEVRDEMIRKLNDAKTRNEPRHNRHLRSTAP